MTAEELAAEIESIDAAAQALDVKRRRALAHLAVELDTTQAGARKWLLEREAAAGKADMPDPPATPVSPALVLPESEMVAAIEGARSVKELEALAMTIPRPPAEAVNRAYHARANALKNKQ